MKQGKLTLFALTLASSLHTLAADIDITISGSGSVKAVEAAVDCNDSCTITNELAINTLQAVEINSKFTGWTGQQCDAGNGVLFDSTITTLSGITNGAKTLVSADINQNNLTDLAYISLFDGQIGLFVNEGNGNFTKQIIEVNLNYPAALAFYDWDNDSDQDLLVTEYGAGRIKLYSNNGVGNFSFTKDMRIPDYKPYAISVEDINQDNKPDLAISSFTANTGGNLSVLVDSINNAHTGWFINNGQDEFDLTIELSTTAAITVDTKYSELSQKMELVAAEIQSGDVAIYSADLISNEITREIAGNTSNTYGVAFDDIDNNGTNDVLSSHYQPSMLQLHYRNADQSFVSSDKITGFDQGVTATAFVDIDNNGFKDLLTGEFNNNKFLFINATGYQDCIINTDSKINVTANFTDPSSNNTSNTTLTPPKKDSSSGGSFGALAIIGALLVLFIRRQRH